MLNFFGTPGNVTSILHTVQQTQQHSQQQSNLGVNINDTHLISNEQWEQLSHNPQVIVTGSEEEKGRLNNLPNSLNATNATQQQNAQNYQQFIPHIQSHASTSTVTTATPTTTTQQDYYNRQSFRVPQYYTNSLSYPDSSRRRRRRSNTHTQNKERKHKRKMATIKNLKE